MLKNVKSCSPPKKNLRSKLQDFGLFSPRPFPKNIYSKELLFEPSLDEILKFFSTNESFTFILFYQSFRWFHCREQDDVEKKDLFSTYSKM